MSYQLLIDADKSAFEFVLKSSSIEVVCAVKNIAFKLGRDFEQTLINAPLHVEKAVISQMRLNGCFGEYNWGDQILSISEKEEDFRTDCEKLTECGQALYGNSWKYSLAEALNVDKRRITHWLDGTRPVPVGVWADIKKIAIKRKQEIEDLIAKT